MKKLQKGSILIGKIKVNHQGNKFIITLPRQTSISDQFDLQLHFWRGVYYTFFDKDYSNLHFSIALAYFNQMGQ